MENTVSFEDGGSDRRLRPRPTIPLDRPKHPDDVDSEDAQRQKHLRPGSHTQEAKLKALLRRSLRPFEVLVVEGSKTDARYILQALLRGDRHLHVTIVGDRDRARAHLLGNQEDESLPWGPPDLVLLDADLAPVDGVEILSQLREMPHLHHVPVVVLARGDVPEDVPRCYELGANCVTAKPHDPVLLMDTVQAMEHYWLDVVGPRLRQAWRDLPPPEIDGIP